MELRVNQKRGDACFRRLGGLKSFLFLFVACSSSLVLAKKPIERIDFIYLYPALPLSYRLPEELRDKKLIFTGNYKKNTQAAHRMDRNDILFTPTRIGNSVLVVRDTKKQILTRLVVSVKKDNLHKIAAEIRELLVSVDGIEIKIYNDKVIVDGQVLLPIEMDRVQKIVVDYGPIVKSYVSYSPLAQKKIAELLEKEIEYPELQIRYAYNRFLLEGCVNTQAEKMRALTIANLYTQYEVNPVGKGAGQKGIAPLQHNIKVPCESAKKKKKEENQENQVKKLIQIVVHFVEMSKSFQKGFFFQWTPAIQGNNTQVTGSIGNNSPVSGITGVLTATVSNFFPKLNWAKTFNFARVLHNSSLLMEEGFRGTISTKTSVPGQSNAQGTIITEGGNQAGVDVTVKPTIQGEGNIIQIVTVIGVSSPADGNRGTTRRDINTTINVRDGASAVIGGLTSSFLIRSYNDDPQGVQGTPILNLYTGKKYNTKQTQFIVFITPIIKSSASVGVDRIKEKFRLDE